MYTCKINICRKLADNRCCTYCEDSYKCGSVCQKNGNLSCKELQKEDRHEGDHP